MPLPLTIPPAGGVTFLNAPLVTELDQLEAEVAVLGIPYGVPYDMAGVAGPSAPAPAAVRAASQRFGYGRFLTHWDFDLDDGDVLLGREVRIVDCGDVPASPLDIPGNTQRATEAVRRLLARGAVPLVLGGDDSIPIPFFRAFEGGGPYALVQVDAHLDFRDEVDGVREGYSSPIRRASEMPWIGQIVQVGMRGVGSARAADVEAARARGNRIVRAREVRERGIQAALEAVPPGGPYIVTIDVDGLDPAVAPGVGAPVHGGLTDEHVADLLLGLCARGRLAGIDVVEIVPARDVNGLTSLLAVRLLQAALAGMVRSGQLGTRP